MDLFTGETSSSETPEEIAKRIGVPLIPKIDPKPGRYPGINDVVGVCGQCGLQIHSVMGYVCNHTNCPTGLGRKAML